MRHTEIVTAKSRRCVKTMKKDYEDSIYLRGYMCRHLRMYLILNEGTLSAGTLFHHRPWLLPVPPNYVGTM